MQKWRQDTSSRARVAVKAITGLGEFGASRRFGDVIAYLRASFSLVIEAEFSARRPFLWLAPLSFLGVLLYFAADEEPSTWAPLALTVALAVGSILVRKARSSVRGLFFGLLAVALGFSAATVRTARTDAPLVQSILIGQVEAIVETVDWSANGGRFLLRPLAIRQDRQNLPYRIRITVNGHPPIVPGDHVSGAIRLMPPPVPARPGGYDFARDTYFARVGGVGSALGPLTKLSPVEMDARLSLMSAVDRLRIALTDRIAKSVGGQSGAVAAALVTGKRGYISELTNENLRAAGIYHVVSISGLHMVLAAGMVFFLVRGFLVLLPGVPHRYPIKQWSAGAAMVGAFAYDIFAGSLVATERSLIMVLVLFGAVLVGRRALSMRNLAFAAFAIIAMEPETVLGPSFQMSFAAVAALIAAFEQLPPRFDQIPQFTPSSVALGKQGPPPGFLQRIGHWLSGHSKTVFLTTLLAEAATGPYSAFHFQRFQPLV